jgi:hypothetical protein
MVHETWIYDMRTGDLIRRVYPYDHGWDTSLKGDGTSTAIFKTDDEDRPAPAVASLRPNARGLAVVWGDTVEYAGKIEKWKYSRDAQTLTVSTVELRNEMMWRLTYGVNQYPAGTLQITGKSASGAVRAVLARAMQWSAEWALPIDLPPDGQGTISAKWQFWRKMRISDCLQQIEEEGWEVYLRPYLSNGRTRIRFETIVDRKIHFARTAFHLQAPEIPIDGVEYECDGSLEVTGVQGLGDGMEQDQHTAWAGSTTGQDIIIRDTKKSYPGLVGARLQAATVAGLLEDQDPLYQWSIGRYRLSEKWGAEHAVPGRAWAITSKGDPIIPDDIHEIRVIATSGNINSLAIGVEVQSAA